MRLLGNALLLAVLLTTSSVSAQTYERFRLPEGTRIEYQDETYQAFNLGEYRELLHMDNDLRYLTNLVEDQSKQISLLNHSVEHLAYAIDLTETAVDILQEDRARLQMEWEKENRLRHQAEQRPAWDWVPWTFTGVLAVTVVVLGIVIGVM